jgi:prepilin-type N-terminal cleavage/methylation domain-containing protein
MKKVQNGFTLVEVLVAVTMMAFVLLAMAPLFLTGMKLNSTAFDKTMATSLAREKLEDIMLLPSGDPTYLRLPVNATCLTSDPRCSVPPPALGPDPCPCLSRAAMTFAASDQTALFYYMDRRLAAPVPNPYNRYLTVQEFASTDLTIPLASVLTPAYGMKRVDVYVNSRKAGLIGLNGVTVTGYKKNTLSYVCPGPVPCGPGL